MLAFQVQPQRCVSRANALATPDKSIGSMRTVACNFCRSKKVRCMCTCSLPTQTSSQGESNGRFLAKVTVVDHVRIVQIAGKSVSQTDAAAHAIESVIWKHDPTTVSLWRKDLHGWKLFWQHRRPFKLPSKKLIPSPTENLRPM